MSIASYMCVACTTPSSTPDAPPTAAATSEQQLRTLMANAPRRGELVVTTDALHLKIRRGGRAMPFLTFPRKTYELACHLRGGEDDFDRRYDTWWLFEGSGEAVALQLTHDDATLWFWDTTRDCLVSTRANEDLVRDRLPPDKYYQGQDAQIAYRMNHSDLDDVTLSGVTEGGDADVLPNVPGTETMIVESSIVAIESSDGRVLLQEEFAIDPQWPCYRAELTVFRNNDDGYYAVVSFEAYGTFTSCRARTGGLRFVSLMLDWVPEQQVFVPAFRLEENVHSGPDENEVTRVHRVQRVDLSGSTLHVERRSERSYAVRTDCVARAENHRATYRMVSADGVEIDLGAAASTVASEEGDCVQP